MSLKIEVKNQKEYDILMEFLEDCTDIEWKDSGKPTNPDYGGKEEVPSVEIHKRDNGSFMTFLDCGYVGVYTVKEILLSPGQFLKKYDKQAGGVYPDRVLLRYLSRLLPGKTYEELIRKTKGELRDYAKGMFGCDLNADSLKVEMIIKLIKYKTRNEERIREEMCDDGSCCNSYDKDKYITSVDELEEGQVYELISFEVKSETEGLKEGDLIKFIEFDSADDLKFKRIRDSSIQYLLKDEVFKLKPQKEEKDEEKDLKGVVVEVDTESEYYEIQKELIKLGCKWAGDGEKSRELKDYYSYIENRHHFRVNENGCFELRAFSPTGRYYTETLGDERDVIFDAQSFLENADRILNKYINLSNKNSMSCCSSSDDRNFLEKMNDFLKKKIDSSTKKQCKAGLRDECCELTKKGKEKLITGLAETEKGTEILDDAAEDILEEREDE